MMMIAAQVLHNLKYQTSYYHFTSGTPRKLGINGGILSFKGVEKRSKKACKTTGLFQKCRLVPMTPSIPVQMHMHMIILLPYLASFDLKGNQNYLHSDVELMSFPCYCLLPCLALRPFLRSRLLLCRLRPPFDSDETPLHSHTAKSSWMSRPPFQPGLS